VAPEAIALTDDQMAKAMGIRPDQPVAPADQIPQISEANQNYTGIKFPVYKPPGASDELLRENATPFEQYMWNRDEGQPPTVGPLLEHSLRPDVQYAEGLIENAAVSLDKVAARITAKRVSMPAALPPISLGPENTAEYGKPLPNRAEIYNQVYQALDRALRIYKVAPPQDFADALIRGGAEGAGELIETYMVSILTGGILNPATEFIARKVPYLYASLFPVVRDAITFGTRSALEPNANPESTLESAGGGAVFGSLAPYSRPIRAIGGATIGLTQQYLSNRQAGLFDYVRNATLMSMFAAIGASHGITPEEAAAYTIIDWAKQIGYQPDALLRALQLDGIRPIANEFAEYVTSKLTAPDLENRSGVIAGTRPGEEIGTIEHPTETTPDLNRIGSGV